MTTIKKLMLISITLLLGVMSAEARAEPTYTATVNGTSYNFTYFTGSYSDNIALLQSQPWWGDSTKALSFENAVAGNLGYPSGSFGPSFAYETGNSVGQDLYSFARNSINNTAAFDIKSIYNSSGIYCEFAGA